MNRFLQFTAIIEALTGIGLILFPAKIVSLLLQKTFSDSSGIIITLICGAAIFSLAVACWLMRNQESARTIVCVLLIYNIALTTIVLFGYFRFGFQSIGFIFIGCFHLFMALVSIFLMQKKKTS
jgi:hypothetical protein